jgi:hypothetical protein
MSKKIKTITKCIYTCDNCGSKKVQAIAWVNPNNDKVSDYRMDDIEDMWCDNCQEHVNITGELITTKKK